MNEEQESMKFLKKWATKILLPFFTACPQIVQSAINAEAFIEDLNKAAVKFVEYFDGKNIIETMDDLLQLITACPQVIQPGLGAEAFVEDLNKAFTKYDAYFVKPKQSARR
jgi:hypothetical protein